MSERPHRVRTWAPKGKTPVLQYSFTWNQLSAVAGVTFRNAIVTGPGGKQILAEDPDGNPIELFEPRR